MRNLKKSNIKTTLKYLSVAIVTSLVMPVAQADTTKKQIGDLEIYKAAEGGRVTLMMMLDTSGSMSEPAMKAPSACNLPDRTIYTSMNGSNIYTSTRPNRDGTFTSFRQYGCIVGGTINPDRITQLKMALFKILDEGGLDASKVAIGIGQFSSQSDENNVNGSADGRTGKIMIPAALLTAEQIEKIKKAVAGLQGTGGTPSANAYAEAGAYMLGTTTKNSTDSGFTKSFRETKNTSNYISPISDKSTASCDGRGIYFLTDGAPNSSNDPASLMRLALRNSNFTGSSAMPSGSESGNGMPQVGAFSQALRDGARNTYGHPILTAVVGFGAVFKVSDTTVVRKDKVKVDKTTGAPLRINNQYQYETDAEGNRVQETYYDCTKLSGDARNACNWGAKSHPTLTGVGGFGEGGFFSAQSDTDVINSIKKFVDDLNQTLPSSPSGTIVVPDDPYKTDSLLAFAYYPTLQAEVGKSPAVWQGNMKKYALKDGTLWGKNNSRLFPDISGRLNASAQDLWSDKDYSNANDAVVSGGYYSNLKDPSTAVTDVRTVYLEDTSANDPTKMVMRSFGVDTNGSITLDGRALSTANDFKDKTTYTVPTILALVKYLGFTVADNADPYNLRLTKPTQPIKVSGATIHSVPVAVSYSAGLDENGRVTENRDDYVLFGSSDGALHLVDADNHDTANANGGQEKFAFIPKAILRNQLSALIPNGQSARGTGQPYFGVDAPWMVDTKYNFDSTNNQFTTAACEKVDSLDEPYPRACRTPGHVRAYGGLRMGGEAIYGLDLSAANTGAPSMIFSITPDTTLGGNTRPFARMGQIWSKPTKARIKLKPNDPALDVIIFGGGYDTCYEDEAYQVGTTTSTLTNQRGQACNRTTATEAVGNAVYIVDAETGTLIWTASSNAMTVAPTDINITSSTNNPNMTNSIVGDITALDRNSDGLMEHLYFADLGGQVFRADFKNANRTNANFSNTRVTRLLSNNYSGVNTKYAYRFYERPLVSFYNNSEFALINLISGDRSSPLSKMRDTVNIGGVNVNTADRVYGIIDNDVTQKDSILFAANFTPSVTNLGANLVNLSTAIPAGTNSTPTTFTTAENNIKANRGWYYLLDRFDGFGGMRYNKGMGRIEVIGDQLYTTVYNPDMNYSQANNTCSAKIQGGSERELYCLPYGICKNDTTTTGSTTVINSITGGFIRAGQGIQELTLGPLGSNQSTTKILIGTRTIGEQALDDRVNSGIDNRKKLGTDAGTNGIGLKPTLADGITTYTPGGGGGGGGGDKNAGAQGNEPYYTFTPKIWYEVNK